MIAVHDKGEPERLVLPQLPETEGGQDNTAPAGASTFPLHLSQQQELFHISKLTMNGDTYSSRGMYLMIAHCELN